MIRLEDIEEAIAECQGQRDPNASTCIKLAAFLTIKEQLFGSEERRDNAGYSFSAGETERQIIRTNGGSELAELIDGMSVNNFVDAVLELGDALRVVNPRLYAGFLRKLN